MNKSRNILIFGETDENNLSPITVQAMSIGKTLSKSLNQELHLILLGGKKLKVGNDGFSYGAEKVYTVRHPLLEEYVPDSYLQVMEQVVMDQEPAVVIFGQTDKGMDLAPRLAFRLRTSVTLDCVHLERDDSVENGRLKQVKPVFGGKAHAVFSGKKGSLQIVSIREGAFKSAILDPDKTGRVTDLNVSIDGSKIRTRFLKKEEDPCLALAQKLSSSSVIVSGGRGLGRAEEFELLKETAELLGGAIAGSRPVVDHGWIPYLLQVGLTGKKLSPQIYFAIGISGAMQHMAGCRNAKTIVAINNNKEAPIFRMSRYGVVGHYREVLKGFNDEYRRIKADRK
jgi:electron transfer flavoprotein alpha subunit